ncbi:VOC family protein [Streptomyces cucumeris]|uniref:VOC family protein n=1 Tax=Streptomyces cucumeris TaxID=2962890 RepID=UPI003D761EBC
MAVHWKLVIDCADPQRLADFWAQTLDYLKEDHSALIERLLAQGVIGEDHYAVAGGRKVWRHAAAVRHPDDPVQTETGTGLGRRLLFQAVPEAAEGKRGKNRLHIDVHPETASRETEMARLQGLGATVLRAVEEPGSSHVVMADPEGNEFCLH